MMKKLLISFAILAVLGVANANRLANGDFEGGFTGWHLSYGQGPTGNANDMVPEVREDGGGSDGGNWLSVSTHDASVNLSSGGWAWSAVETTAWEPFPITLPNPQLIPVIVGETIAVSGKAKLIQDTDGGSATFNVRVAFVNADGLCIDYNGDGYSEFQGNLGSHPTLEENNVRNLDRVKTTYDVTTGWDDWTGFAHTVVVPELDLLGNPIDSPPAYMVITFGVSAEKVEVGFDEIVLIKHEPTDPVVVQTADTPGVPPDIEAVFYWKAMRDLAGDHTQTSPDLFRQDFYLGDSEPNQVYIGSDTTVSSDPSSQYPAAGSVELIFDQMYSWCIVSILDTGDQTLPSVGDPLSIAADPNNGNLTGPVWEFESLRSVEANFEEGGESATGIITWVDNLPQALTAPVTIRIVDTVSSVAWAVTGAPDTVVASDPNVYLLDGLAGAGTLTNPTNRLDVGTDPNNLGYYNIEITVTTTGGKTTTDTVWIAVMEDSCTAAKEIFDWAWLRHNYYDFDSNCLVDLTEFAMLAEQWLDESYQLTTPLIYY